MAAPERSVYGGRRWPRSQRRSKPRSFHLARDGEGACPMAAQRQIVPSAGHGRIHPTRRRPRCIVALRHGVNPANSGCSARSARERAGASSLSATDGCRGRLPPGRPWPDPSHIGTACPSAFRVGINPAKSGCSAPSARERAGASSLSATVGAEGRLQPGRPWPDPAKDGKTARRQVRSRARARRRAGRGSSVAAVGPPVRRTP